MSFDIFLQRFETGESASPDREAILVVLRRQAFEGPDPFGFYIVSFADGGLVEFSAKGLESNGEFDGCAFHLRGFSDALMNFIWEVARAGDMVILASMDQDLVLTVSEHQENHLPDAMLESFRPCAIGSPGELQAVLKGGYDEWSNYRNRIIPE